jgi:hypothetical protein
MFASLLAFASQASAAPAPPSVLAAIAAVAHVETTPAGLVVVVDGTISAPDAALAGQTLVLSVGKVVLGVVTVGADGAFHLTRAVDRTLAGALHTVGVTVLFAGVTVHRTLTGLDGLLGLLGLIPVDVHIQALSATVAVLLDSGVTI